jgi:hypothetical protein
MILILNESIEYWWIPLSKQWVAYFKIWWSTHPYFIWTRYKTTNLISFIHFIKKGLCIFPFLWPFISYSLHEYFVILSYNIWNLFERKSCASPSKLNRNLLIVFRLEQFTHNGTWYYGKIITRDYLSITFWLLNKLKWNEIKKSSLHSVCSYKINELFIICSLVLLVVLYSAFRVTVALDNL